MPVFLGISIERWILDSLLKLLHSKLVPNAKFLFHQNFHGVLNEARDGDTTSSGNCEQVPHEFRSEAYPQPSRTGRGCRLTRFRHT